MGPGNGYAQVRQTILKRLAELKDPETGERVVKRAYVREELYRGPFLERAPDVVLELNLDRGYSYTCLPSVPGAPPIRWLTEDECRGFKGRNVNGSHRREGVKDERGDGLYGCAKASGALEPFGRDGQEPLVLLEP